MRRCQIALSTFKAKEEEIEKKKLEVKEKVQAQLGRIEEETRRLAIIREELEALADPMKKEVQMVRKRIDAVNKELKPLGQTCQKKEREYKEVPVLQRKTQGKSTTYIKIDGGEYDLLNSSLV
ncbi:hypothetical protein HAX54_004915 [Datura stramonium]|uniref:RAB6-interacting golgin n=1 Tax=Datura stramonium TaxID=4076 RepID=A0ABS8T7S9_DATST|nr:hypothetical protein [Datura stramonium]